VKTRQAIFPTVAMDTTLGVHPIKAGKSPMLMFQKLTLAFVIRNALIVLSTIVLGTALATDAIAAGHADHSGGPARGGFSGPILTAPSTPPTFNPYYQYTVPQAPETPVSPASSGSVFGNN
jgi:hypothetical protein